MTPRQFDEAPPALSEPWSLGDVRRDWPAIIGAPIAAVTSPLRIGPTGRLVVSCDSAVSACEARELYDAYRHRFLREKLPRVIDGVELAELVFVTADTANRPDPAA